MEKTMIKLLARCALFSFVLLPCGVAAEPIELKLAFFSSDRSSSYLAAVKPFIDAVNSEGKGQIQIVLHSGGVLGKEIAQQPQVVLDGNADIAFVVTGYTPNLFPDNAVIELPGLFRDMREATLVYTQLIALNALNGYKDFFVIGAYITEPATIHGRMAINSIEDLKGKRIRVNNPNEAATFEKLGALPILMQITRVAEGISGSTIDGAAVGRTALSDYGIKRVAINHYFLGTSGAPLALIMNRNKFEALPKPAQDIVRKYSGQWVATRFIESYEVSDEKVMEQLKSEPQRKMIFPTQMDLDIARVAYKAVIAEWAAKSPRNRELLKLTETEISKLRVTR
jgi:TRAP-type C4-dicarboxylate transport system substrate-binding protein